MCGRARRDAPEGPMLVRTSLRPRRLAMPILAAGYLAYFGFHAFHGSYGVFAMADLTAQAGELQAELATLTAERNALDRRAARLRPESLDRDMMEERARSELNLVNPNDVILLNR